MKLFLRKSVKSDLELFFRNQADEKAKINNSLS
jgi:hypothetical protein